MLIVRFKMHCQTDKVDGALSVLRAVIGPSRALPGVLSFDIGRDLSDPDCLIATEVFEDAAAMDTQESLPEVGTVLALLPEVLAAPPEATRYHVSLAEPHVI
ncbi:MAG TPA: antibiotic biosynthesis monooxygenase [Aeromicrobium sp.]|nr:antibiotic biosynthesis monooxygenase [Aeromicrobium sp.]